MGDFIGFKRPPAGSLKGPEGGGGWLGEIRGAVKRVDRGLRGGGGRLGEIKAIFAYSEGGGRGWLMRAANQQG